MLRKGRICTVLVWLTFLPVHYLVISSLLFIYVHIQIQALYVKRMRIAFLIIQVYFFRCTRKEIDYTENMSFSQTEDKFEYF